MVYISSRHCRWPARPLHQRPSSQRGVGTAYDQRLSLRERRRLTHRNVDGKSPEEACVRYSRSGKNLWWHLKLEVADY